VQRAFHLRPHSRPLISPFLVNFWMVTLSGARLPGPHHLAVVLAAPFLGTVSVGPEAFEQQSQRSMQIVANQRTKSVSLCDRGSRHRSIILLRAWYKQNHRCALGTIAGCEVMTDKQEAFVKYYTATRDAKAAVRHAGYSRNRRVGNIVREVLHNPNVKAAILKSTAEGASSPTPVVMDEKFIWAKLEYLINANLDRRPQIALKALELAGRKFKLWVDRLEVDNFSGHAERIQKFMKELEEVEKEETAPEGSSTSEDGSVEEESSRVSVN